MHAFDRRLFWRALGLTLVATVLATAVVAGTDEAQSTWAMRLARLAAFAPGLAGLGTAVSLGHARSRGELRALAALGVTPWRAALGPMLAAWLVGALAIGLVVSPLADVSALFPSLVAPSEWRWQGAALVDAARGLRVEPDGRLQLLPGAQLALGKAAASGWAAGAAVAPLVAVTPTWVSAPMGLAGRVAGLGATLACTVGLLHAVGANRLGAVWLVACAAPLALQALRGHAHGR